MSLEIGAVIGLTALGVTFGLAILQAKMRPLLEGKLSGRKERAVRELIRELEKCLPDKCPDGDLRDCIVDIQQSDNPEVFITLPVTIEESTARSWERFTSGCIAAAVVLVLACVVSRPISTWLGEGAGHIIELMWILSVVGLIVGGIRSTIISQGYYETQPFKDVWGAIKIW